MTSYHVNVIEAVKVALPGDASAVDENVRG